MRKVLHLTTHLNIGGITSYIQSLTEEMRNLDYEFYIGSSGGTQDKSLSSQGAHLIMFDIKTKSELSPKIFRAIEPLRAFIADERIDLIHAHTRVTQVLAWYVQRLTGIPYVSTCHGFYKRRLGRRLMPAWGNHVIAISKPVEESLLEDFSVPLDRVSTIYNAINVLGLVDRFRAKTPSAIRRDLGIPNDSKVVGIVSRVVADKGHEYFLRAVKKLMADSHPNVKVIVVGEGPYLSEVRRLAHELGIEDKVYFLGMLQDITYALSVIDVFVLPATWREGFGLSIIEAMAVKVPVIVTNIWALNELIHDRVNGLLVPPKEVGALADAIKELLGNGQLYQSIAQNGSEMVSREFSIQRMAEQIDRLYDQVLSQQRSGSKIVVS